MSVNRMPTVSANITFSTFQNTSSDTRFNFAFFNLFQLSHRCRARDIEEFFSSVGNIRDVRLIICNKTRRFKGIAYVEFKDIESVALVSCSNLGIMVLSSMSNQIS